MEVDVEKINDLTSQIAGIDQYLRINNIEIVGLHELEEEEEEESMLIDAMNSLNPPTRITSKDIDIAHVLPTNRKDGKSVCV